MGYSSMAYTGCMGAWGQGEGVYYGCVLGPEVVDACQLQVVQHASSTAA